MCNAKRLFHSLWELKAFVLILQATFSGMWSIGITLDEDTHTVTDTKCIVGNYNSKLSCIKKIFDNYNENGYTIRGIAKQGSNNVAILFGMFTPAMIGAAILVFYSFKFTYKREWGTLAYAYSWIELKKDRTYKTIVFVTSILAFIGICLAFMMANTSGHPNAGVLNNMIISVLFALVMGISDLWRSSQDIVQYDDTKGNIYVNFFVNGMLTTAETFKDNLEDAMVAFQVTDGKDGRFALFVLPEKNESTAQAMFDRLRANFMVQQPEGGLFSCARKDQAKELTAAQDKVEIERAGGATA